MFRTDGLLRALTQAEPDQAAALRGRLILALAEANDAETGPVQTRIRAEALRAALISAMSRAVWAACRPSPTSRFTWSAENSCF